MFDAKKRGYDIDLYRSTENRWIAGVCGGLADNMRWSAGGVRALAVLFFLFSGTLAVLAYIAAIILINKRPATTRQNPPQPDTARGSLKEKVLSPGSSASSRLNEIRYRLQQVEARVRTMEQHVTSRKFQFERELRRS